MFSLTPTTELEAVNIILKNIGEAPVNSLEVSLPIDASKARATLHEISRQTQNRGWHWNTEIHELQPNVDNKIAVPSNALRISTTNDDEQTSIIMRGSFLYKKAPKANTYTFDRALTCEIIFFLDFEELPEAARRFVTMYAAKYHQEQDLGSPTLSRFDDSDVAQAWAILRQEETKTAKPNIGTGSLSMQRILNRKVSWQGVD